MSRLVTLIHHSVVGLMMLGLAGCLSDAVPIELQAPLPHAFSQSGQTALPDKWWEAFHDDDLNAFIDLAMGNNPSLLATWDRLRQAEAVLAREGAARFPALDGNVNASRSRDNNALETDRFSLGVSMAYELDLWGRIRANTSAAHFDALASESDVKVAGLTLSAEIAKAWYSLIEQRGQLDVLEQQFTTNKKVLHLVTLRFRQGLAGAADVLRQQQLIEQTHGEMKDVVAQIETLTHQLAILGGHPPKSLALQENTFLLTLPPLPDTGLPADVLQRRPDVQGNFYQVQAADARIAAAIADRFPRIDLTGALTTNITSTLSGGSFASTPAGLFSSWLATVAAQVVGPIIDAGARAAEVERNEALRSEALNNYESTVLQAMREVEDALTRETQQREKTLSLERQLKLATQVIERLRARYVQGATDFLDVLNALISQQGLERQILAARRNLIDFRVDLAKALAGGWELPVPTQRELNSQAG
ncbi:efflux transporter outer membrane subunit [Nitrospira sp. M1]